MAQNPLPLILRQLADSVERSAKADEPIPLWTRKQIADFLHVSVDEVDRCRDRSDFPKPIYVRGSKRMPRWKPAEIEDWTELFRESC